MKTKKLSPAEGRQREKIQTLAAENSITELEQFDKSLTERIDVAKRETFAACSKSQQWWIEKARRLAFVLGERLDWPDARERLVCRFPASFGRCEDFLRLVCKREQVREAIWLLKVANRRQRVLPPGNLRNPAGETVGK